MDKQEVIAELRRVAELLQTPSLTRRQFAQHSRISETTVRNVFGSWNKAVESAGLAPNPQKFEEGRGSEQSRPDDEYLQELIRLTVELGKQPTWAELSAFGRYSPKPYRDRWGSLASACQIAYARFGYPQPADSHGETSQEQAQIAPSQPGILSPQTYKPEEGKQRKKVQFGEPIDFRGLRFAPINEQGVVYVFGMVSRELGFLIESIRTEYPDCEGKRCVDEKRQRWEHVLIEFE